MKTLCKISDLAPGRLTSVNDGKIVLTLINGNPVAVVGRCPHQGAALEAGHLVDRVDTDKNGFITTDASRPVLRCPWHGFEFDLATGMPLADEPCHRRMRLRRIKTRVQGDDVVMDR